MKILVLGGYGLIGQAIVRELQSLDHTVIGLAREPKRGRALFPDIEWIDGDLNKLLTTASWQSFLTGVDAVINASGALQSGGSDDLAKVQNKSIRALVSACEASKVDRFIQISAPGVSTSSRTEFYSTKAIADQALRDSQLNYTILKPGLVISPTAYGGTSLLRMLAAVPYIQPITLANAQLQTIGVDDVARSVARSLSDPALSRGEFDLVSQEPQNLRSIVLQFREWLGFPKPAAIWEIPSIIGRATGRLADLAGSLGWRSPLRTTALNVLEDGVLGDPKPWQQATGQQFATLSGTLLGMPATRQERIFARTQLVFPILVVVFALFWIASGIIGVLQLDRAAGLISGSLGQTAAIAAVLVGSIADVVIGIGLLIKRAFVTACLAAIGLSLIYLIMGTVFTPGLWSDPLGPLVKVLPVIALSAALIAMAQER